jgi:predicted MFS family arabinose efflux permease
MLLGMNGGGALIGALTVASLPRDTRRESIVRWSMFAMAAGLIALSFVRTAVLSVPVLLVMGATFLAANSSINTNLQAAVPPDIRGRVMSLFVLAFMGLMPLGALAYGAVGQAIGVTRTMLIGGTLLAAYAALLIARPALLCGGDADCG